MGENEANGNSGSATPKNLKTKITEHSLSFIDGALIAALIAVIGAAGVGTGIAVGVGTGITASVAAGFVGLVGGSVGITILRDIATRIIGKEPESQSTTKDIGNLATIFAISALGVGYYINNLNKANETLSIPLKETEIELIEKGVVNRSETLERLTPIAAQIFKDAGAQHQKNVEKGKALIEGNPEAMDALEREGGWIGLPKKKPAEPLPKKCTGLI